MPKRLASRTSIAASSASHPAARPPASTRLRSRKIVDRWHASAELRREFGDLATEAAFRRGIADGTIRGYDAGSARLHR